MVSETQLLNSFSYRVLNILKTGAFNIAIEIHVNACKQTARKRTAFTRSCVPTVSYLICRLFSISSVKAVFS